MNYTNNPGLLASLADAYVVGTLSGPARRRFEALCAAEESARAELRLAEDRLVGLSLALGTVEPASGTWLRIVAQIEAGQSRQARRRMFPASNTWRMALAAAVATLAIGLGWLISQQPARPTALANIAAAGGAQLWTLDVFGDRESLTARVTGAVTREPGHSYELWALPEGRAPVSLGLLPETGAVDRTLTSAQRAAIRSSAKVAVSLEPAGGSRTGAPTGPVLYVAELKIQSSS